jgi:hypothetical protein
MASADKTVLGYRPQSSDAISIVNSMKRTEEEILRVLDLMKGGSEVDQHWLALGRSQLEQAFMAITRSVFRPQRVTLPDDPQQLSLTDVVPL